MAKFLNLFKRQNKQPVIIVSGLPRSGTSMMMSMLQAGGVPLVADHLRVADEDNPKGYYEFEPVKNLKDGDFSWLPEARGKAVKVISALLSHLPDSEKYLVIFMRREMSEILASQKKMLINRDEDPEEISDQEMSHYFESHLAKVTEWLENQSGMGVLYVDYNRLLKDPTPGVAQINAFLGDKLEERRMVEVVDPKLYRQRAS